MALLEEVRSQAPERTLSRFTRADALALGLRALSLAEQDGLPVAIRVTRGEQVVFHAAREGATAEHDGWVRRKARSVRTHEVSSLELVLRQRVTGRALDWLDPREFAVAGGAVPIVVGDAVVGVISVSGLVGSIRDDHDLAMAALRGLDIRASTSGGGA
ncbi:heme-binding protein [Microbacterium marinilacus]|uniref:heme-binding protein n=1 Tax=Microbacterium marinilacus TaxID=415209 RepID=UPI0031DE6C28|nr:heme-binding protein [Microbacterium marinilacus]